MYTISQIKKLIAKNNILAFYNDSYWRRLSKSIIKEQHGECQHCKENGKYSPAILTHHVKELRKHPELAYSRYYVDTNGIKHRQLVALCNDCHEKEHPNRFHKKKSSKFTNEERW